MIRVLVVDDHPIVRSGLSALVDADAGLQLVAAAGNIAEAHAVTEEPEVALVDLDLPDGDGIDLGADLKQRWPTLRVLILTMHADDRAILRSLAARLDGYLLKDSDPEEIVAAIYSAARGGMVLGSGASEAVVAAAVSAPRTDALAALDARDLEILELLLHGYTTSRVANKLFLAPKTIHNRVSAMATKLGVSSREEAIALARAARLGNPPRSNPPDQTQSLTPGSPADAVGTDARRPMSGADDRL